MNEEGQSESGNTTVHVERKRGGNCNYWWFLAVISLFIGAIGFTTILVVKFTTPEEVNVYGIVFDAGSTHTAMNIYKWSGSKTNGTAEAEQMTVACRGPALSSFEANPLDAGSSLTKCLDKAKTVVPSEDYGNTEVFLGATAGMRLLNASNPTASESIFYTVRQTISSYPFRFDKPEDQAQILSGEEEGAYSWITVNYFAGTLGVKPMLSAAPIPITHGALDMGGASTQMTFTSQNMNIPDEYKFLLRLYGINHTIYTHSFLCYGVNEALRRYQARLVQDQRNSTNGTIQNPCGPKGDVEIVPHNAVFEAPCTKGPHALQTYGYEILPREDLEAVSNYSFMGESDPVKCQALTDELFNFTQCSYPSCSFNGAYLPPIKGDFYAFSSFFYQVQFLNLTNGNTSFTLAEFEDAVKKLCKSPWDVVKTMKSGYPEALPWYCFETSFVLTLLTKGYHFNSSNWNSLFFKEKVNNADLGWALGLMINSSNKIPVDIPEEPFSTLVLVLLIILFAIFLFIAAGFVYYAVKVHRLAQNQGYEKMGSGNSYGAV